MLKPKHIFHKTCQFSYHVSSFMLGLKVGKHSKTQYLYTEAFNLVLSKTIGELDLKAGPWPSMQTRLSFHC